ncbi:MAG: hypothetical protein O7B26_07435, partial [Planctomycetota bacterium]|nr:hypothetical protein [Planctomycetota bacterium]
PPPAGADRLVRRLVRFLGAHTDSDAGTVANDCRELAEAGSLAASKIGSLVQAYILAGASSEQIADLFDCEAATIELFAKIHFDVRRFLRSRIYLMGLLSDSTSSDVHGRLAQLIAVRWGRKALDQYAAQELTPELRSDLQELLRGRMLVQAVEATLVRPVHAGAAHDVIREHLAEEKLEQAKSDAEFRRERGAAATRLKNREAVLRHRAEELKEGEQDLARRRSELENMARRLAASDAHSTTPGPSDIGAPHLAALRRPAVRRKQSAA